MNIDRGTANLDLLTTWLTNRINKIHEHHIRREIKHALRTCVTCEHFDKDKEVCKISDNLRPPATVIAYGCDKFQDYFDDIPF